MTSPTSSAAVHGRQQEEIEQWLVQLLARQLKVAAVDPQAPLTGYNLNSMAAMRLLDKLERWLGCSLPATIFFDYPDIRTLSQALATGKLAASEEYVAPDEDCYR